MSPNIMKVGGEEDLKAGLDMAGNIVSTGGAVAFPTESFYGLGVDATNENAIQRLFDIKKRGSDHPVLILISSKGMLDQFVAHVPELAKKLIRQFWPGGLTLVFEAGQRTPRSLTAGTGKIGVRLSNHPIATGLVQRVGVPITGTSANVSGEPACVKAEEVSRSLRHTVDLILDGGETEGGKGSTILDITVNPPKVLREGMVSQEDLKAWISL
jgi:L-threonylcarbamoyladenylate synthase